MAKVERYVYAERIENVSKKYEFNDEQMRLLLDLPKEKYAFLLKGNQGVLTDKQRYEVEKRLNYFEDKSKNKDALKYTTYYIENTLKKEYNLTNKSIAKLCNVKKKTIKRLLNNKKINRKDERNIILNILQLYETVKQSTKR
ncbi:HTH domain-containing protein [Mammaliicoccus sp. Dog046]|uniref:HTH domain-containing protein n=1 Tax=Mammaliicoccus sp. Dog046 TaxID=3034233 RepID=UPI002B25F375|nr:HTH domain-containing protein [Mammaliicoccus sp. Dog046]WQK85799.1 HTH domain-containing protein [Mammaliicoccus sp. Dog046]